VRRDVAAVAAVAAVDDDDVEEAAYARALKEPDSLFLAVERAVVAPVHRIGAYGLGAGSLLQVRASLRAAGVNPHGRTHMCRARRTRARLPTPLSLSHRSTMNFTLASLSTTSSTAKKKRAPESVSTYTAPTTKATPCSLHVWCGLALAVRCA